MEDGKVTGRLRLFDADVGLKALGSSAFRVGELMSNDTSFTPG